MFLNQSIIPIASLVQSLSFCGTSLKRNLDTLYLEFFLSFWKEIYTLVYVIFLFYVGIHFKLSFLKCSAQEKAGKYLEAGKYQEGISNYLKIQTPPPL